MKNETAKREIESLDYYLQNHTDDYSEESHTAMMMAIKALEQEPCDVFDEYGNYKYPSDVKLTEPNTATSMPCEDAISREDALMALTGEWTEITDEIIHRFIKRIKALPPVNLQPCEDAISREATLKPYNGLNDEDTISVWLIRKNIEEQPPVNPQPEWIPVSERLPKENKTVIVSTKYGVYPEARYTKEYGWEWAYESGADYWRELENVTAWMPLPKQYEPQESEDKG